MKCYIQLGIDGEYYVMPIDKDNEIQDIVDELTAKELVRQSPIFEYESEK